MGVPVAQRHSGPPVRTRRQTEASTQAGGTVRNAGRPQRTAPRLDMCQVPARAPQMHREWTGPQGNHHGCLAVYLNKPSPRA